MISKQQTVLFLKQLRAQYPSAFKRNYLFYSMIKTKGILDELKELIPWLLAAMIFISLSISLGHLIAREFAQMNGFRAQGLAVLAIMLLFMLYTPLVIKQIKHSSISMYQQLRHTPIKLAALIVFYVLGLAVRKVLNLFVIPAEEPKVEDGAVIEKEVEAEENQEGQAGE